MGGADGEGPRYKASLVAKGYRNQGYIIMKYSTLLCNIVFYNMEVEWLDVKAAFFHGDLEETIYMKQSENLR